MDDLGPEFGQLRADERLRDENAGADRANALERTEAGRHRRSGRALQIPDPVGNGLSQFLDLILIFHDARIVRHGRLPHSRLSPGPAFAGPGRIHQTLARTPNPRKDGARAAALTY